MQAIDLHYTLSGNDSTNLCLLFIHGFACNENDWHNQVSYFANDYQILTCSLRGHGKSTIQSPNLEFDIPTLAYDITYLLNKLNLRKKITVIGHSMSSRVALELYYQRPQQIEGIVLIDCGYSNAHISSDYTLLEHKLFPTEFHSDMDNIFARMFIATTKPEPRAHVLSNMKTLKEQVARPVLINTCIYDYYAMPKVLKLIKVPTLILQSTLRIDGIRHEIDNINHATSDWLELVKESIPQIQIQLVPHCGHFIMLEQPEITNIAIATFLQKPIE